MFTKKFTHLLPLILLLVAAAGLLLTCGIKHTTDPLSATNFAAAESSSLHDGAGATRAEYYFGETVYLTLDNLYPDCQTLIRVRKETSQDCSCKECESTLLVATDRQGRIEDLELWYNVGYDNEGNPLRPDGNYTVQILQPSTSDPWIMYKIKFKVLLSLPVKAYLQVTDTYGIFKGNGVLTGNDVYAKGGNLGGNKQVKLYVVKDKSLYSPGDLYQDESGGAETVTTAGSGELKNTKIWPSASSAGVYDVIVDTAPFDQYNAGDLVINSHLAGLIVQAPPSGSDIVTDIACDEFGNYRDVFAETDAVYAKANPLVRPADLAAVMDLCHSTIFVAPHRSTWNKGDYLIHIEAVGSMDAPIEALVDPTSGSLGLSMVRGEAKPGYQQPLRLWPGDYDVILDVNNNYTYDPGVDILDGGSRVGFKVAGTPPPVKLIFFALPDFPIVANGKYVMRAVVLRGDHTPVVGATVAFNLGKGSGYVDPKSGVTDAKGMTHTYFWGAQQAQWSLIRAVVTVDGVQYEARISAWGDLCLSHNQGIIIGG